LDATPLFHWNVKVVFLYLTVEYQISSNLIWKQKGKGCIVCARGLTILVLMECLV